MAKDSSGELTTRSIAYTVKPTSKTNMMFSQLFVKTLWMLDLDMYIFTISIYLFEKVKLTQKRGLNVALEKPSFLVLYLNE